PRQTPSLGPWRAARPRRPQPRSSSSTGIARSCRSHPSHRHRPHPHGSRSRRFALRPRPFRAPSSPFPTTGHRKTRGSPCHPRTERPSHRPDRSAGSCPSKPASRAPRSVQISTPVGPPPTTTKVSHARRESISSSSSEFSKAPIPLALHERVGEGLHARRPLGKLILTEVTLPDACCDHQAVVRESCPPPIRTDDGYRLLDEVDIDHVAELHLRVHMLPQHFPRRRRD